MKKFKYGPRTRGEIKPLHIVDGVETVTKVRKNQPVVVTTQLLSNYPVSVTLAQGAVMHDVVVEDFQKKKAAGIIVNNPMDKLERWDDMMLFHTGLWYSEINTASNPATGDSLSITAERTFWCASEPSTFPAPNLIDLSYVRAEAINAAFANAHQRNVMGLVDMAEIGKTSEMLRTNLGRLESLMTRGVVKTLTKKSKKMKGNAYVMEYKSKTGLGYMADAANLHLEVNYGVIPLMLSINGLVKTLTEPVNPKSMMKWPQTFRGSESATYEDVLTASANYTNTAYPAGGNVLNATKRTTVSQNTWARAGVMTRYKPTIQAMLGLELRDIVPGAHELIPLSFVLDWVFNVGTYLEAVTPVPGFRSEASWVTLHNEVVLQYTYERLTKTMTNTSTNRQIYYPAVNTEFVMGHRSATRIPGAVPTIPHFNSEIKSLTHFISGAALSFSKVVNSKSFRKALTK